MQDVDVDVDGVVLDIPLRFPGQIYEAYSNLNYNYFRDYDPDKGRYVQSDPIGLRGGLNTYGYVGGNPMNFADPKGLKVLLCTRPVDVDMVPEFLRPYLRHSWIKTDKYEAGMGGACPIPGQNCADKPYSDTTTKDHSGQSQHSNAECQEMKNVDESCVDDLIRPGQPTGTWHPYNQCQSFSNSVIGQCRYGAQDGPLLPSSTLKDLGPLGRSYSPAP